MYAYIYSSDQFFSAGGTPAIRGSTKSARGPKKCINSPKNAKTGQNFAFSMLKVHQLEKSTSPLLLAVLTNIRHAS